MKLSYKISGADDLNSKLLKLAESLAPNLLAEALKAGGEETAKQVRKNIAKQGLIDQGDLLNAVAVEINGIEVLVSVDIEYAAIHEYGGIIRAKNGPFLIFQIDGQWVQVPQVEIPARPYFRPALAESRKRKIAAISAAIQYMIRRAIGR